MTNQAQELREQQIHDFATAEINDDTCPVQVLGIDGNGRYWYVDPSGRLVSLTASQHNNPAIIDSLFGGEAMGNIVIVESIDAANDQAGNVRGSGCHIFAEIGEIYAGTKVVPQRTTTVFDSVGIAIMDVAAASLAFKLAMQTDTRAG